ENTNHLIWHEYVLYFVLGVGVLFTIWSGFGQYRALTHGVQVVRGVYDDKSHPGAINHFQALSTALSATVGLGNIAGVAIAVSLGGPGAVFWMWVVGLVGMCLKMTEVTQAMLYRDTSDPDNPHGGAMWVMKNGLGRILPACAGFGRVAGAVFCVTLLVSAITGGNMFQAWNVADISFTYFGVPKLATGIVLTLLVGLVIVGGIRRIGGIAGRIVPFMCLLYILAGLWVIAIGFREIPGLLALIVTDAFRPGEAGGAFIGGAAGYGFLKGMQRALFSNEAGQGSAPIAHSAAKTDEPVREGIVAGLEPFIDTLCVCTITALVILLSGSWNRPAALEFSAGPPRIEALQATSGGQARDAAGRFLWTLAPVEVRIRDQGEANHQLRDGSELFLVLEIPDGPDGVGSNLETGGSRHRLPGRLQERPAAGDAGAYPVWIACFGDSAGDADAAGLATLATPTPQPPRVASDGVHFDFKGATLTAKSFDHALPGLGFWIVPAVVWLFAFSTIISWSYYGEQGIVFLLGIRAVMPYRIIYCLLILVTVQIVRTETQLDILSTLGTGLMLWANIPIMLLFGREAMRNYHDYFRRLRTGEMKPVGSRPTRGSRA
ncbi:MAG: amino acid carrier protein, partial [Planctomycetota bacterium]